MGAAFSYMRRGKPHYLAKKKIFITYEESARKMTLQYHFWVCKMS